MHQLEIQPTHCFPSVLILEVFLKLRKFKYDNFSYTDVPYWCNTLILSNQVFFTLIA